MTLDDVYGAEFDRFPLEQDAMHWESIELEWDDEAVDLRARLGQQLSE